MSETHPHALPKPTVNLFHDMRSRINHAQFALTTIPITPTPAPSHGQAEGAGEGCAWRYQVWTWEAVSAIMAEIGKPGKLAAHTVWRVATKTWLHINGY